MTGKIKLNATSGGGSVSFQAPSSTGDDRIITLPTTADGTVLTTTNPKAGNIIQVVQTEKSDVVSAQPDQTFTDISGFTASITPSSTTSKILVTVMIFTVGGDVVQLRLLRDGSNILLGDTVTNKLSVAAGRYQTNNSTGSNYYGSEPMTLVKLDSPSTTSAITYKMQWRTSNSTNTLYLNRNLSDTSQYAFRTASTITLMEVAA